MSRKMNEARESLDESLRPIFDELVDDYRHHAVMLTGQPWVAYKIIAKLVETGWRCEEPVSKPKV